MIDDVFVTVTKQQYVFKTTSGRLPSQICSVQTTWQPQIKSNQTTERQLDQSMIHVHSSRGVFLKHLYGMMKKILPTMLNHCNHPTNCCRSNECFQIHNKTEKNIYTGYTVEIFFPFHDSYLKCQYLHDLRASNSAMISDCVDQGKVCSVIHRIRIVYFCILIFWIPVLNYNQTRTFAYTMSVIHI